MNFQVTWGQQFLTEVKKNEFWVIFLGLSNFWVGACFPFNIFQSTVHFQKCHQNRNMTATIKRHTCSCLLGHTIAICKPFDFVNQYFQRIPAMFIDRELFSKNWCPWVTWKFIEAIPWTASYSQRSTKWWYMVSLNLVQLRCIWTMLPLTERSVSCDFEKALMASKSI